MRSFIMMAGIVILSMGCGGGGGKSGGAGASGTIPQQPLASTTIDNNGGNVTVNNPASPYDRTSIDIPAGALTQPTIITVNEALASAVSTGTLPVILEPSGTTFALPVTLRLPYTAQLVQIGDDQDDLVVLATNGGNDPEIYPAPQVGTGYRLVSTTTTHFSIFEVLFPRDYKLYRQPSMLFDSASTTYEMGITRTSSSPPYVKTEYHPVLARGPSNLTITLGKGTLADFFASNQGNVILIHGLMSSPTTFYFDANGQPNDNGLLLALRNDPAFNGLARNVILYQYPSGWPVGTNAKALMNLIAARAQPGFRTTIIAHSMGGIIARYAIERLDLSPYVEELITLGTPHEGGQSSYFSAYFTNTHLGSLVSGGVIPSLNDIVGGSALLNDPKDGLNTQFPGKKGSVEYFLAAGKQSPSMGDDKLVTVGSATSTYLQVPLNHQAIFERDARHDELHSKARTNGVLMKIREWVTGQPNRAPIVNAGLDQTIIVNTPVTLTGSATDPDLDTITYAWTQTTGTTVTLGSTTTATATFTPTQIGAYTFQLTANDTVATGADTVTITVNPLPPVVPGSQTFTPTRDTHNASDAAYNANNPTRDQYNRLPAGDTASGVSFWAEITFGSVPTTIPRNATIVTATLALEAITSVTPLGAVFSLGNGSSSLRNFSAAPPITIDVTAYIQSQVQQGGSCFFRIDGASLFDYGEFYASEDTQGRGPRLTIEWR